MSSYPFPQLWLGQESFYLDESRVAHLSSDFWISAEQVHECAEAGSWHVADFGAFCVFANGASSIVYTLANGFQDFIDYQSEPVLFGTCCNFNGQLFIGNIFTPPIPVDVDDGSSFNGTWADANADCVGWSKIGNADLRLDKSNVSGFRPMGLGGVVQRVLPLGKGVMAYNANGVQFYYPTIEHAIGFGMREFDIPGCASRSAVSGSREHHVMVDTIGQLWHIKSEQAPQLLGYQEYFWPMLGKEIVVTYNDAWKAFDITDGENAYRLTQNGLARVWQAVTSQFATQGNIIGSFHPIEQPGFELVTDVLDFGFRGHKTITSVEFGGSCNAPVFVSVDWRSHNEKYFRSTPWIRLGPNGIGRPRVTADEFRIKLQCASKVDVEIDYIQVKYQITDRRNTRGSTNVDSSNA